VLRNKPTTIAMSKLYGSQSS